jgi:hypothetical protein
MVIPGYDPEDIDDTLEAHMDEGEIEQLLSGTELQAYRDGDASLIDLLSSDEIQELIESKDIPLDVPEDSN